MERLDNILKDLGLDDAMTVVFEFMADKRKATFEQIYDGTRLSRRAISLAVEALEAKGAVKRDGPFYVVEDLREALISMAPARFEEIKAEIHSYRHEPNVRESCPDVKMDMADVTDVPASRARDIASAISQVDIISRMLEWLDEEVLEAIASAIERGVRVRILTDEHPGIASDIRALRDVGAEVRVNEYARYAQLLIIDGTAMALDLHAPPRTSKYPGLRLRDRELSKRMLEDVFEPAWSDAESP
jgi:phosphatidylserine/phosphatidylglycerophosphate/cardiolipin synthase-like enzyme